MATVARPGNDPAELPEPNDPTPRGGRRGLLLQLLLVLVVVGALVLASFALARGRDGGTATAGDRMGAAAGAFRAPTTLEPRPVPTTPPTTEALPLPDALPANWYENTPEVLIGRLQIPKFGVDEPFYEGITLTVLNKGPGHWPGTAEPGRLGNMVVAGHRTTYSKPFNRLDELVEGDQVIITTDAARYVYAVRGVIVVPESHIGIAAQSRAHVATLFACHPKGSATHRIVAKLALLGPDGTFVDDPAALPPVDLGADPATGLTLQVKSTGEPTPTGLPSADG